MIESKHFEMKKGTGRAFAENFKKNTIVRGSEGLLNFRVMLNEAYSTHDIVEVVFYWESEEALMNFKRSEIHKETHKHRKQNPDMIKHSTFRYELLTDESFA